MPSRKQRRRREKLHRHEWEEVYVDEEGRELAPEEVEDAAPAERNGKKAVATKGTPRAARPVQPPSWRRAIRRLGIFAPLMFLVIWLTQPDQPVLGKLAVAAFYSVMFVPFIYLMDRFAYRTYVRRLERQKR